MPVLEKVIGWVLHYCQHSYSSSQIQCQCNYREKFYEAKLQQQQRELKQLQEERKKLIEIQEKIQALQKACPDLQVMMTCISLYLVEKMFKTYVT